ncbi:hypothetical protein [Maricaulis sp.]|uniref:LpxL/LpxP family acyltransferase n=1 Tax=Maricaulis sp. TaxID=1486257 RepID=UPI003A92BAAB
MGTTPPVPLRVKLCLPSPRGAGRSRLASAYRGWSRDLESLRGNRCLSRFIREISTNPDKTAAIVETVTRINEWVESEIRQAPEQWFWVHRRWAKSVYKSTGA